MIDQLNSHHTATDDAYEGLLTLKEAATYLGLSYSGFYNYIANGQLARKSTTVCGASA
jgi:predicted DNA-binding transcriptional regulator AlpA